MVKNKKSNNATSSETSSAQKRDTKNETVPVPKRRKTPLQCVRDGENAVDIKLAVLVADAMRTVKTATGNAQVWTIVCGDGVDFVNITAWGNSAELLHRELGTDFLGQTVAFTGLSAKTVAKQFNYGSVPIELRFKEGSVLEIVKSGAKICSNINYFFDYISNTREKPDKCDSSKMVVGQLYSVKLREVRVSGYEARVLDAEVIVGGKKCTVTAWNILGEYLHFLLRGKEGSQVDFYELQEPKNRVQGKDTFIFALFSVVKITEQQMIEEGELCTKLEQLIGKTGLSTMSIRVRVARQQNIHDFHSKFDITVVIDGDHKAQLYIPSSLRLESGTEVTITQGTVEWTDSGILSMRIHDEGAITKHNDALIDQDCVLAEMDYPEARDVDE